MGCGRHSEDRADPEVFRLAGKMRLLNEYWHREPDSNSKIRGGGPNRRYSTDAIESTGNFWGFSRLELPEPTSSPIGINVRVSQLS